MEGSLRTTSWLLAMTLVTSAVPAAADAPPLIDTPFLADGELVTPEFYYGRISIAALMADPWYGAGRVAELSLDDGETFSPAGIEPGSPIALVNTRTIGEQISSKVARLASGGYVITWITFAADGDSYGVFAQRYAADGSRVGTEQLINATTTGDQTQPSVVGLVDGGFAVVWTSSGESGGQGTEIVMRRFDADGTPLDDGQRVNDSIAGLQLFPAMTALADGGLVVVWQSQHLDGRSHIFAKRYDATGQVVPPPGGCAGPSCELRIDHLDAFSHVEPAIAALAAGGFVVAWSGRDTGPANDDEVYAAMYQADGQPLSAPFLLRGLARAPEEQRTVTVAPWGDGFLAAWASVGPAPAGSDVVFQAFTDEGVPIFGASERLASSSAVGDQASPKFAAMSDGSTVIGWRHAAGTARTLAAQRFAPNLDRVGGELALTAPGDGVTANPSMVGLPDSAFVATWQASGNPSDTSQTGIFVRHLAKTKLIVRDLDPRRDLSIRFRVSTAGAPGEFWMSPVRLYRYGDPNAGADGQVVYPDGITNATEVSVGLVLPANPVGYQNVQLYRRSAALGAGLCGAFGAWQPFGIQTTLTRVVAVPLVEDACEQFKWHVTTSLGLVFEYTSDHVVKADRTAPSVAVTPTQVGTLLRISVSASDAATGIASLAYRANGGPPIPFTGPEALVPLQDGGNGIRVEATDLAGNAGAARVYFTADLRPAVISLVTLEDGATYPRGPILEFTTGRPLQQVEIFVDGSLTEELDLGLLGEGTHAVTIRGLTDDGQVIERTVTFVIDREAVEVALTSPQARTYFEDEVTVTLHGDVAIVSQEIRLDGVVRDGPLLTNLADGQHTVEVTVTTEQGATATRTRTFAVQAEAPTLEISSPREAEIVTSRSVPLVFRSNSAVSVRIAGVESPIAPGEVVTLPGEGPQTIVLTATHASGATIQRTINVEVDSVAPRLEILSPREGLYSAATIPIDVRAQKPLRQVETRLDGVEVTALHDLVDGPHLLEVRGTDFAGRSVSAQVAFHVAHLDITTPREGQVVVDNALPPAVELGWSASDNFTTLSASVDGGPRQLLPSDRSTTSLQLPPGLHTVIVQGAIDEHLLARRVSFRTGARNVSANANSIKYRYTDCDTELRCTVTVTLQIENTGQYDLSEPFSATFSVLSPDGSRRDQQWPIAGVAVGERRTVTLTPFSAVLDDIFALTVDPDHELLFERVEDNEAQVSFQPGKILAIEHSLSAESFFITGARIDQLIAAATVGPVAFLETTAGGLIFRDSSGDQGFVTPVDMGQLTPQANYVVLKAYDASSRLLDARIEYFDVRALHGSYPLPSRASPWTQFRGAGGRIFLDTVDQRALARAELDWVRKALSEDAISLSHSLVGFGADGRPKPTYQLVHSDAPVLRGRASSLSSRAGVTASAVPLEDPLAVGAVTALTIADGACSVVGYTPLTSREQHRQAILDGLDTTARLANFYIETELEPSLEAQIRQAYNELSRTLEPFTNGFGIGAVFGGFFAFAIGDIDLTPPNISNIRFQFVGDLEDFALDSTVRSCTLSTVGSEIFIDSEVAFDLRFRRRLTLSATANGGISGFALFGAGNLWVPAISIFGFVSFDARVLSPTFVGSFGVDMGYQGGLHGSLPAPRLEIDRANLRTDLRFPRQVQRVAEAEAYAFIWIPILIFPITGDVQAFAYAELQAQTLLDTHLREPIVLSNPIYRDGAFLDSRAFAAPSGHVFAHARSFGDVILTTCFLWFCRVDSSPFDEVLASQCQKVSGLELVSGTPGVDCPTAIY